MKWHKKPWVIGGNMSEFLFWINNQDEKFDAAQIPPDDDETERDSTVNEERLKNEVSEGFPVEDQLSVRIHTS